MIQSFIHLALLPIQNLTAFTNITTRTTRLLFQIF